MPDNRGRLAFTTEVIAAYVAHNQVAPDELPTLITETHSALAARNLEPAAKFEHGKATPAEIRRSIRPDGLVSFEDGRTYQTLKRHLATRGLTVAEYREKWGLPEDYPATAADYARRRSEVAKQIGLGGSGRIDKSRASAT